MSYTNPFPGSITAPGRTDEGVDPTITKGGPIVAIGNAKIVALNHNFYGTTPYLVYELTDGPRQGRRVYVSEYFTPRVVPGQQVKAGEIIGVGTGRAIETGWAGGPAGSYLPLANKAQGGDYTEGKVTAAGTDFAQFLGGLGTPGYAHAAFGAAGSGSAAGGGGGLALGTIGIASDGAQGIVTVGGDVASWLRGGDSPVHQGSAADQAGNAVSDAAQKLWDFLTASALKAGLYLLLIASATVLIVLGVLRTTGAHGAPTGATS